MHRFTSAHAIALLALFVALGGSSYAALKVRGKDVVNGSLTGKDIKKRSVPLDRLSGKLPAGPKGADGLPGAKGDQGIQGPPGTPDGYTKGEADAKFLGAGVIVQNVPGDDWRPVSPNTIVAHESSSTYIGRTGAAIDTITLSPDFVSTVGGRAVRVAGASFCFSTSPQAKIESVSLALQRHTAGVNYSATVVASDPTDRASPGCTTLTADPKVAVTPGDALVLRANVAFTDAASLHLGPAALAFDQG